MTKARRIIIICVIIILLIAVLIPSVYVLGVAVHNMINGFIFDFRGTMSYGMDAFVKTLLLYVMIGFPVIILQVFLLLISAGLFVYLLIKNKK